MRVLLLICVAACGSIPGGGGGIGGGDGGGAPGSGGGGGADALRQAVSGTRLRVRYVRGEDGSRQFLTFQDMARNEACSFLLAEDGKMRCLPWTGNEPSLYTAYFEDAACAMQVAWVPSNCPPTKYGYSFTAECPAKMKLFALGASVGRPSQFYANSGGNCVSVLSPAPADGVSFVRVTGSVPPSSFVAGEVAVE